jgi:hypothetical protein
MKRQGGQQKLYLKSPYFMSPLERLLALRPIRIDPATMVQVLSDVCAFALALLLSIVISNQLSGSNDIPWAHELELDSASKVQYLIVLGVVSLTAIAWFWGGGAPLQFASAGLG